MSEGGFGVPGLEIKVTKTKHHQSLVDIVFRSQESKAIADLLHAWTANRPHGSAHLLLGLCACISKHDKVFISWFSVLIL